MKDEPENEAVDMHAGPTAHELIRRLKDEGVSGAAFSIEEKLLMVEYLMEERYSTSKIAAAMKMNPRSIRRYEEKVRNANSLKPHPGFAAEVAGNLMRQARINAELASRVLRDKNSTPADLINCARTCWNIERELVVSLQEMGYVPRAPVEVRGQLRHQVEHALPNTEALVNEVRRIRGLKEMPPEFQARLSVLEQGLMSVDVLKDATNLPSPEGQKEEN